LFVLVLIPKGFASSCTCIGDKCLFVVQIRLIDCSRGLESTPQPKKRIVNYTTLSLRYNLSLEVNCTLLMEQFSNLKTANIRKNPIYCERVNASGHLKIITDCNPWTYNTSQDNHKDHFFNNWTNIHSTTSYSLDHFSLYRFQPVFHCKIDYFDDKYYLNPFHHSLCKDCDN